MHPRMPCNSDGRGPAPMRPARLRLDRIHSDRARGHEDPDRDQHCGRDRVTAPARTQHRPTPTPSTPPPRPAPSEYGLAISAPFLRRFTKRRQARNPGCKNDEARDPPEWGLGRKRTLSQRTLSSERSWSPSESPTMQRRAPVLRSSTAPWRGGRLGATMERLRRDIGWWLSYIPRLIGHFRNRRQLGQSIGPALRSARERMRQSRSGLQKSPRSPRRRE